MSGTPASPAAETLEVANLSFTLVNAEMYTKAGERVNSKKERVGKSAVCLSIFPCGTAEAKGRWLTACIRVIPDVLWRDTWSIPDVTVTISVLNHHPGKPERQKTSTFNFSKQFPFRGWHDMGLGTTSRWSAMKREGWISAKGDLSFNATVKGAFSLDQPLTHIGMAQLWTSQKCTDVVVAGEDGVELRCHGAVLASASPILERMLSSGVGSQKRIVLRDVSGETLRDFLLFMYTQTLPKVADFQDLMRLADIYELPGLGAKCVGQLASSLGPTTAVETLRSINKHRRCLEESDYASALKRIRADRSSLPSIARQMVLDEKNRTLRQKVIESLAQDDRLLERVVCPFVNMEEL